MQNIVSAAVNHAPAIKQHQSLIAAELFKIKTAYPTQARNFSNNEVAAMNMLWNEVFHDVDIALFHEAVIRYIRKNKSGFFPSPGQVYEVYEEIIAERNTQREIEIFDSKFPDNCGICVLCLRKHNRADCAKWIARR